MERSAAVRWISSMERQTKTEVQVRGVYSGINICAPLPDILLNLFLVTADQIPFIHLNIPAYRAIIIQ